MRSSVSTSRASPMAATGKSTSLSLLSSADDDEPHRGALGARLDRLDPAAKALAAGDRRRHFDLRLVPGGALEIAQAHQRPVDAGRRNFEPIGLRP